MTTTVSYKGVSFLRDDALERRFCLDKKNLATSFVMHSHLLPLHEKQKMRGVE